MTALRNISSMSTSIMRSALLPRFSLNHTQIRTVLNITAFEKAMQEVHGDSWKGALNRRQRNYVNSKEQRRELAIKKLQEEHGDQWEAVAAKQATEYQDSSDKVRELKTKLLQQKNNVDKAT